MQTLYVDPMCSPNMSHAGVPARHDNHYHSLVVFMMSWNSHSWRYDIPEVKVTELFSVLSQFVVALESDDDLEKLVLVAPPESEGKAKACVKKGGKETPFKLGERIVVL